MGTRSVQKTCFFCAEIIILQHLPCSTTSMILCHQHDSSPPTWSSATNMILSHQQLSFPTSMILFLPKCFLIFTFNRSIYNISADPYLRGDEMKTLTSFWSIFGHVEGVLGLGSACNRSGMNFYVGLWSREVGRTNLDPFRENFAHFWVIFFSSRSLWNLTNFLHGDVNSCFAFLTPFWALGVI